MEKVEQLDSKIKMWELNWNMSVTKINVNASVKRQKFWVWVQQNPILRCL